MIEGDQPSKRALQKEEDDDEVMDILNSSTAPLKKLKETHVDADEDDEVMNIIDSSLNNGESNGKAGNSNLNDTNNNVALDEEGNEEENNDEVMDIIENSMTKGDSTEANDQPDKTDDNDQTEEGDGSAFKLEKLVPKAAIHQVETEDGCLHEVVTPIDVEYKPMRNFFKMEHFKPAKEYPFAVDPFQREAILCIENNQSVLGELSTV